MQKRPFISALWLMLLVSLACRATSPEAFPAPSQPPFSTPAASVQAAPSPSPQTPAVPTSYASTYTALNADLEADLSLIGTTSARHPTTFAAELIVADDNRGTALLTPATLPATALYLDRLRALGIKGVKSAIQFPLLTPAFPRYSEYLDFSRAVGNLIRQRGMTWTIQASILFANTPFSEFTYDFSGLTFREFEAEDRAMIQTIITELKPDYLSILAEPDTAAKLTGLREFNDPAKGAELVNYVLSGLDRGSTRICAGTGSWTDPAYSRLLAETTKLDCVAIHIYPVQPRFIQNALTIASDARANGKAVIVSEAWLYKLVASPADADLAANTEAFKLDAFSFWAPLDQKFLDLMAAFSDAAQVDFLSVFWSPYLFSYVDYAPGMMALSYDQVRQQANAAAAQALSAGIFSPTGLHLKALIAGR